MQNLQSYYRDTMKWSGGPHLFVADDLVWAFTPLTVPGVHSPSWNNVSWGVELVGDYSTEQIVLGSGPMQSPRWLHCMASSVSTHRHFVCIAKIV